VPDKPVPPPNPTRDGAGRLILAYLAVEMGVNVSTVSRWAMQGMPRDSVEKARAWKAAKAAESADISAQGPPNIAAARLEKIRAETERIKFRLLVDRNQFLPVDQIREEATTIGSVLVAELSALANDLPGHLAGLTEIQIRDRLLVRLDSLIEKIRGQLESLLDVRQPDELEEAPRPSP
jgi:hypothetical protein